MAISEYQIDGKTFYQVYVQARSKIHKVRAQKLKKGIESITAARREEHRLLHEVFEEIGLIEGRGYKWEEIIMRWEIHMKNRSYGKSLSREAIIDCVNLLYLHTPGWLHKRVGELTRLDGRKVLDHLIKSGLSISRIKFVKGTINRLFSWGIEEGLITDAKNSPVHGIELPKEEKKMKPILTINEIKLLLIEAQRRNHPWKDIWAVALLTGMRSGELYALEWRDIDLDNKIIRITKSFSQKLGDIKSTKNTDWRNGHISADLENVLAELKNKYPDSEFVLPRLTGWSHGDAGFILREFLHSIGIEKYVNFHTLRACFATHVLASGAEPTQVMKMGGWADFKTFQIYIRMAGVDVKGVTDNFQVMPKAVEEENVLKLR